MAVLAGKKQTSLPTCKRSLANSYINEVKRVFGRRHGRPLSPTRKQAFDDLYDQLKLPLDILKEDAALDPASLFTKDQPCVFEIGFGSGEHVIDMMTKTPDRNYIAAEPFDNGMTMFLKQLKEREMDTDNLRVLMDDALYVARSLKDNSLDEIYILNPDPWPKTRHHKRRIVRQDTLDHYARVLKKGGRLIMTTDVPDLAQWMVSETIRHGQLNWTAKSKTDWETAPEGWSPTKYELKGAKGAQKMAYLIFEK